MSEEKDGLFKGVSLDCLAVCFYFLCMPFTVVPTPVGSLLKVVTMPVTAILAVKLFVGERKPLRLNCIHLTYSLYIIYTVFGLFLLTSESAVQHTEDMLLAYVVMMLMSMRVYSGKERRFIEASWLIIGAVCVFLCVFSTSRLGGDESRTVVRIFGYAEDPNQFCAYLIMPTVVCLKKFSEKSKFRYAYIFLIIFILYAVFKTGSRGGLIAILVAIVCCIFLGGGKPSSKLKLILVAAAGALIVVFVVFPLLPPDLRARFSIADVVETGGTGRVDIWKFLIDYTTESYSRLMYGSGIMSTYQSMEGNFIVSRVAHNQLVQVFADQGIIGLALFLIFVAVCAFRTVKREPFYSAAFISVMALSMSLSLYTFKPYINIVIMCAMTFEKGGGETTENAKGREMGRLDQKNLG